MSLTLTLALRYLRRGRPISALILTAIPPATLLVAVPLASRLGDLPAWIQLGVSAGMVILAAWLGLVKTLVNGLQARAAEFASLREAGATPAQIRGLILTETILLTVPGTLLGLLAGLALVALTGGSSAPSLLIEGTIVAGLGLASGGAAGLAAAKSIQLSASSFQC